MDIPSCGIERNIFHIAYGAKDYYMELALDKIAVYEKYQDSANNWHVSITPKYFLSGIECIYMYNDIGSCHGYNILDHLHKCKVI